MNIRIYNIASDVLIALDAEAFDAVSVAKFRPLMEEIPEQPRGDVYLDLRRVESMDSSAVGAIAYLFKRLAAKKRRLSLIGPTGQPRQLLQYLRIDKVIDIRDDLPFPMLEDAFRHPVRSDAVV